MASYRFDIPEKILILEGFRYWLSCKFSPQDVNFVLYSKFQQAIISTDSFVRDAWHIQTDEFSEKFQTAFAGAELIIRKEVHLPDFSFQ